MADPIAFEDMLPVNPSSKAPESTPTKGVIPFDSMLPVNTKPKAEPKKEHDIGQMGLHDMENKRLGGLQFTSQGPSKETYLGPATHGRDLTGDEEDDTYYMKDEKGNYSSADKNKHLIFRDPDTGEHGIYKRNRDKDYGPITGRLVGLGNLVQEGLQAAPTRLASTAGTMTRGQGALRAASEVADTTGTGVRVPQNAVTENLLTPKIAAGLEALPGGSAPFERSAAQMEGGLAVAKNRAAAIETGHVANAESGGEAARAGIEAYAAPKKGILAKRVSDAYDKLDAHMPADVTHDLGETRKIAQDLQSRYEATGQAGYNPTISKVFGAVTDPKGISYQGLKDLRSELGEMLESGTKISETGISDKQLRALYKGLTDDMKGMVQTHGGDRALQLWERANTFAQRASKRREGLAKILGTNRSDEAVLGKLHAMAGSTNAADAKTLALAKKSMPADQWSEVASAVVDRLGNVKTPEGKLSFDAGKFVKDYDTLSDRGKALLFGDNQRLRKALDSISELSKYEPKVAQPGPVAHLVTGGLLINHAGGGEGATGKFGRLLHAVGAVVSMKAIGNMLTKPATAESVAKWMQGYKIATLKPTRGNVMLFDRASEALAGDAAKEDRENIGAAKDKAVEYAKKLTSLVSPFGAKNGQ